MPASRSHRPCGCHRRLRAPHPVDPPAVPIHASLSRLFDIRHDSPQLRPCHGHPPRRGRLANLLRPAAAGHHAGGWDAGPRSACPGVKISWPSKADRGLLVGRDLSGVVNTDLVLSAAEAGYRPSEAASCSCSGTLDLPA